MEKINYRYRFDIITCRRCIGSNINAMCLFGPITIGARSMRICLNEYCQKKRRTYLHEGENGSDQTEKVLFEMVATVTACMVRLAHRRNVRSQGKNVLDGEKSEEEKRKLIL